MLIFGGRLGQRYYGPAEPEIAADLRLVGALLVLLSAAMSVAGIGALIWILV